MTYDDNPRKVYGKVKIVYADGEISKELNVETSGNGDVSNPNQIYMGYISPQIKACTMDGNSYMGQGFQMNGHGLCAAGGAMFTLILKGVSFSRHTSPFHLWQGRYTNGQL